MKQNEEEDRRQQGSSCMELIETNQLIKQKYAYMLLEQDEIREVEHRTNSKKLKIQLIGIIFIIALYLCIFVGMCIKEFASSYSEIQGCEEMKILFDGWQFGWVCRKCHESYALSDDSFQCVFT